MGRNIEKYIRKLGYDREDLNIVDIDYSMKKNKNLSKKTISHSISENKEITDVNFDFSAATGSLYTKCTFSECSMEQVDFEFCSFNECIFRKNKKIISSFNNSNFINTLFEDENFEACTFCGVLFDNCIFKNTRITLSTFEGAYFNSCIFENIDLSTINMDYIQLDKPTMINVILPFSQIPYMFGAFQYLRETNDNVSISSNGKTISKNVYLNKAVPQLLKYWTANREKQPEYNFPLSNFYIFNNEKIPAAKSVEYGLKAAIDNNDYRMIKFYCKLINISNFFKPETLELFYSLMCKSAPNNGLNDSNTRSFIRNIGEIRESLFYGQKRPSIFIKISANLHFYNSKDVGEMLNKLFSLTKMNHKAKPNISTITLSENSPFMIELNVSGTEDNVILLLTLLARVCDINDDLIFFDKTNTKKLIISDKISNDLANDIINYCTINCIKLSFLEYQISNCEKCEELGIYRFFYAANSFGNDSPLFLTAGKTNDA